MPPLMPSQVPANPFAGYLPPEAWAKRKDLFFFNFEILNLGTGVTSPPSVQQAPTDSGIVIVAASATVTDAATDRVQQAFFPGLVSMQDSSQQDLQTIATHFMNLFGTGTLPAYWPYPKLVSAAAKYQITVTNSSAAAVNIRMSLWSMKVFGNS